MRTTINLEDRLLREAKRRALTMHSSLSEVINRAVRLGLPHLRAGDGPYQTITFGVPGEPAPDEELIRRIVEREDTEWMSRKVADTEDPYRP